MENENLEENLEEQDSLNPEEEDQDSENLEEEEESNEEENEEEEDSNDSKAEEVARNQKIRAEKAEKELKKLKAQIKDEEKKEGTPTKDLSTKDLYILMENKVPAEDVDDVVEYAKFKNISVEEAMKSGVVKATLQEKAETRKSASATPTGKSKSGPSKTPISTLLNKFEEKGELPESDEDMDRMLEARYKKKS